MARPHFHTHSQLSLSLSLCFYPSIPPPPPISTVALIQMQRAVNNRMRADLIQKASLKNLSSVDLNSLSLSLSH